jgi:hypothetical protein
MVNHLFASLSKLKSVKIMVADIDRFYSCEVLNIQINFREMECEGVNLSQLADNRFLVLMNIFHSTKSGNFLTC